jgi:glycosyltransferase involved in cell wall biosynthesis
MKIAIDVTASIYKGTGVATYYNNLVPKLLEFSKSHEIITFGYSLRRLTDLNLATKKFPLPPSLMDILWNRLHIIPVETLIGTCDLLHAWDYIQPPTKKAKIVTTIHDLTPFKFPKHQHPRTIAVYKHGLKWVKKNAAAVIVDSFSTKQDLTEFLKIPETKIHVIYLAAPDRFKDFRTRQENTRDMAINHTKRKYSIEREYLISVGTQEPRKNLHRTIRAYEALNMSQPLVIVGRFGWGLKAKPTKWVKLLGFVPDEDLPALYAGASCFIYPSIYEGFGLPVLEAMAVGCPVVTSDRGSLKEVAGGAAVEVNPESVEAIAFGIKVALQRSEELIKKGMIQAQKFSWEKTARQTLDVYDKLHLQKNERAKKTT